MSNNVVLCPFRPRDPFPALVVAEDLTNHKNADIFHEDNIRRCRIILGLLTVRLLLLLLWLILEYNGSRNICRRTYCCV